MLGRPRLLREEDIDQDYPQLVNDKQLNPQAVLSRPSRNCLQDAPVFHAKLARILARASQDLYPIQLLEKEQETQTIDALMQRINQWRSELPPLLGDTVCSSSLISIFQRQLTVIRLAQFHAVLFVTRPLLLRDCSQESIDPTPPFQHHVRSCIATAHDTLQMVFELAEDNRLFPTFWYTQYITFNALSIVYIYLVHSKRGRIPYDWLAANASDLERAAISHATLCKLAQIAQQHLGQVTEINGLAWRYTTVLEALRIEAAR